MIENPFDGGHFDRLAPRYNEYRTLDLEPVRYLASKLPDREHTICELGCGTGRYLIALVEHLRDKQGKVKRAYGVDTSPGMLQTAKSCAKRLEFPISWVEASAVGTGLPSTSISLVTAFNVVHHLPLRETLDEVARLARPGAVFAVYTRVREQEAEHIWGRWFPEYLDHSVVPTRHVMLSLSRQCDGFRLIDAHDFTFWRTTTIDEIREQTESRFYSTLAHYSDAEFERAYATFVANLKSNIKDPGEIRYPSRYSMFLYEVGPDVTPDVDVQR